MDFTSLVGTAKTMQFVISQRPLQFHQVISTSCSILQQEMSSTVYREVIISACKIAKRYAAETEVVRHVWKLAVAKCLVMDKTCSFNEPKWNYNPIFTSNQLIILLFDT
jgi:hypothetical protein